MKMMNEKSIEKLQAEINSYFRSNEKTRMYYAAASFSADDIQINTPEKRIGTVSKIKTRDGEVWHAHDFVKADAMNAVEDVLLGEYTINE